MTAPGLVRCPRCGYIAELHGLHGMGNCTLTPSEIKAQAVAEAVLQPDSPRFGPWEFDPLDDEKWRRQPLGGAA